MGLRCRLTLASPRPRQPPRCGRRTPSFSRSHPPLAAPPPSLGSPPLNGSILGTRGRHRCLLCRRRPRQRASRHRQFSYLSSPSLGVCWRLMTDAFGFNRIMRS